MIVFELKRNNNTFKIIKFFLAQYTLENKFSILCVQNRLKRNYEDELFKNHIILPYGVSNIKYNIDNIGEINFQIKYIKVGIPVGLECETDQHEEMFLTIDETLYPNYKDIIDILLINARNYYEKNVNNKEINTEKVTCYIWDEYYWDDIYKRKKRSLNTVHLNENANKVFKDMKDFLSYKTEKEYEYLGLPYKRNYLFEGYPGTGKTSLIYSLASELNMDVAIIQFNNDIDDIKFTKAMMKIPKNTLLILEDIDVLFNENRKKNDINKNKITLSGLLNILDGLMHQEKQIIIMTTNFKCTLDNALQRPGRIDYILHFDFATKNQINAMFDKFLPNQSERFVEFYKLIKNINITTATLQQFLFQNRSTENIIDKIDELKKLVSNIDYSGKHLNLYM